MWLIRMFVVTLSLCALFGCSDSNADNGHRPLSGAYVGGSGGF